MNPIYQPSPLFQNFHNLEHQNYEQQLKSGVQSSLSSNQIQAIPFPHEYSHIDVSQYYMSKGQLNQSGQVYKQDIPQMSLDPLGEFRCSGSPQTNKRIEVALAEQLKNMKLQENESFVQKIQENPQLIQLGSQRTNITQFISNSAIQDFLQLEYFDELEAQINWKLKLNLQTILNQIFSQQKQGKQRAKTHKRKDDSNNAHKKMITCLNRATRLVFVSNKNLSKIGIKCLNQHQLSLFKKIRSSRYGFICKLIEFDYVYGPLYLKELFVIFSQKIIPQFIKDNEGMPESKAKEYLLKLPEFYMKSFDIYMKGEINEATEMIYKMDINSRFKQKRYMLKGIKKVLEIRNELFPLK